MRVRSPSPTLTCGAGPSQNLDNPLGIGGVALHEWAARRMLRMLF